MTQTKRYERLLRELPDGSRIDYQRAGGRKLGKHPVVVLPGEEVLRESGGRPIFICVSPGDWRGQKNEVARIRRALAERTS